MGFPINWVRISNTVRTAQKTPNNQTTPGPQNSVPYPQNRPFSCEFKWNGRKPKTSKFRFSRFFAGVPGSESSGGPNGIIRWPKVTSGGPISSRVAAVSQRALMVCAQSRRRTPRTSNATTHILQVLCLPFSAHCNENTIFKSNFFTPKRLGLGPAAIVSGVNKRTRFFDCLAARARYLRSRPKVDFSLGIQHDF